MIRAQTQPLPRSRPSADAIVSTMALTVVAVATLVRQLAGLPAAGIVADVALALYLAVEAPKLPRLCKIMVVTALALAALAVARQPDGVAAMAGAFGRATLVAALLAALGFVNEAARTSPLIRRCGTALIAQPSQRRYLIMTLGAHLFALVLGVGVLTLLGSMIVRSNAAASARGDAALVRQRLRELSMGLMRGFCTMPMWSPLSIGLAVVLAVVPGVSWDRLIPVAAAMSVSFLALGWLLDGMKLVPAFSGGALPREEAAPLDWRPMARFAALALLIAGGALGVTALAGVALNEGVMLTVPVVGIGWLIAQYARYGLSNAVGFTAGRLRRRLFGMFPNYRIEICLIGAGTIMGSALGALVPPDLVRGAIQAAGLAPAPLAAALLLAIIVSAQAGMGAVVGVTILGSAIPDPSALQLTPLMLAVTFLCAWALSSGSAVYGTTLVILSRMTEQPGGVMAFRWNGAFTVLGYLLSVAWLLALAGFP
ncbi:hypothetical protein [Azospirillum melinis]